MRFIMVILVLMVSCTISKQKDELIAKIGNEPIYTTELDSLISSDVLVLRQRALHSIIYKKTLLQECKEMGISVDEYNQKFISPFIQLSKIEVNKFLNDNHLELNRSNIYLAQNSLAQQKTEEKKRNLMDSLIHNKYKIYSFLLSNRMMKFSPSKYDLYFEGNSNANLEIIILTDFNCPECRNGFEKYVSLVKKYQNKAKFYFVNFTIVPELSSLACEAAGKQRKYYEMFRMIFKEPRDLNDTTTFIDFAKELELNIDNFKAELNNKSNILKVSNVLKTLLNCDVNKVPTVIINNKIVYDELSSLNLDEILFREVNSY